MYIVGLRNIYTDMDEFRNIIGVFVKDDGCLYFDPCSEAAYASKAGKYLRGTHKSNASAITIIPVSFVRFLQNNVPNLKINQKASLNDISKIKWH
ncbi:MAG: hypothetical protein E7015_04030 [Alphaproteobacteria bacterium]|nr:hypothetical protein [Alphaproteobacteria bacterium]